METSAVLLAIAALGGVVMAVMRLKGRELPPLALAVLHGLVAAAGLVTLVGAVKGQVVPMITLVALAGFVIAALGGAVLFLLFHLKNKGLPIPLMFIHAAVAAISFVMLLISIFRI